MKSSFKGAILAFFSASLLLSAASAQESAKQPVTAQDGRGAIYIEGRLSGFVNEQGERVRMLRYRDSHYMPLRAAGEWMGKTVTWDQASQTVSLSGSRDPIVRKLEDLGAMPPLDTVDAYLCPSVTVLLDGVKQSFADQQGATVYPLMYQDVLYLPLRNISELSGMEVTWADPPQGRRAIFVRMPLTADELEAGNAYITRQLTAVRAIREQVQPLSKAYARGDRAALRDGLSFCTRKFHEIAAEPKPALALFDDEYAMMQAAFLPKLTQLDESLALCNSEEKLPSDFSQQLSQVGRASLDVFKGMGELKLLLDQTGLIDIPDNLAFDVRS